jgi:hypothetical protein
MSFLNNWNININELNLINNLKKDITNIKNISLLLNTQKKSYNLIEQFVYEIALFHFNRLNIPFDSSKTIEFCFNTNLNNNLQLEKNNSVKPLLKTYTYLNDSKNISIITNIDNETYKYKNFVSSSNIYFYLNKYLNHIAFEGGSFYHSNSIFENDNLNNDNLILTINLWDKLPSNINIYNDDNLNLSYNTSTFNLKFIEKSDNSKKIGIDNNVFKDLFENIFYRKDYNLYSELISLIENESNIFDIFIFDFSKIILNNENKIENINKFKSLLDINSKKFVQRFNYKNFYNTFSCNWIISEINNFIKNNNEFIKNKNKINIENANNILNFVLFSFQEIIKLICLSYCIDESNKKIQISDIYIIKNDYKSNLDVNNFMNDESTISVKILLNNNYTEGMLCFDDGIKTSIEKGELIIHNGNEKYKYDKIENGTQYLLCGLINIYN